MTTTDASTARVRLLTWAFLGVSLLGFILIAR
jgi:hypothetical protein